MAYKLHFISLGCAKNMVNCEQMMALCRDAGMELCSSPEGCDAAVVNTCGFLSSANEEAIENILAMAELKKAGKLKKILVTGCMTQRYQGEVAKELPEVDGILGTGSYKDIVDAVETVMAGGTVSRFDDINAPVDEFGRVLTTPGHYAFLRIAEGCDNWCAFCIIPKLRANTAPARWSMFSPRQGSSPIPVSRSSSSSRRTSRATAWTGTASPIWPTF